MPYTFQTYYIEKKTKVSHVGGVYQSWKNYLFFIDYNYNIKFSITIIQVQVIVIQLQFQLQ